MQPGAQPNYKVCPQCRQPADINAQFCSRCGLQFGIQPIMNSTPTTFLQHAYNKKLAAGICGILLGSLGIHKFILGYTTAGIIMLLVSVVGGVITCGAASSVVAVIGIVEGILYLTKSDQQFFTEYIQHQKEWF